LYFCNAFLPGDGHRSSDDSCANDTITNDTCTNDFESHDGTNASDRGLLPGRTDTSSDTGADGGM
jgi:hypothetical protein